MINLLPPTAKEQKRYGRRNVHMRWYAGLILIISSVLVLTLIGADWYARSELKRMDEQYQDVKKQLEPVASLSEQAKGVQSKLSTLKQLFAKETNYVSLLEDIEAAIVPGSQLQQLELDGDESKALEMRFVVNDKLLAATLRTSLENSARFKFVDIQDISETDAADKKEITVTYKLSYEPGQAR